MQNITNVDVELIRQPKGPTWPTVWGGGGLFPKFVGVRTMVADKGQEIVQSHTCGGLANWQILGENPA